MWPDPCNFPYRVLQQREPAVSAANYPSDNISYLINVLQSGITFYSDGIKAVSCDSTRALFSRILREKQQACTDLMPYANQQSDFTETSLLIEARKLYTHVVSKLSADSEQVFVDQLVVLESRVLKQFDDALNEKQSQSCAQLLRKIRTRMQQCYDELLSLKQARTQLLKDRA